MKIGTTRNHKRYSLEKGTQVEYLGEKRRGFYKVVVTTKGTHKGRQGWVWGGPFEEVED
ncbi:MAG: hypothetical protein AB1567_08335 [bacterium]